MLYYLRNIYVTIMEVPMKQKGNKRALSLAGAVLLTLQLIFSAGLVLSPETVQAASASVKFASSIAAKTKSQAKKDGVKSTASSKIAVAKVLNYTNVYSKVNEKGKLKGRLYRGSAAFVIKKSSNFSYISSGSLKGWVKNSCLTTGKAAKKFVAALVPRVATVTASKLNIRAGASTSSHILAVVPRDTQLIVMGDSGSWVRIRLTNVSSGYVSRQHVKMEAGLFTGVTRKQEKKMEAYLEAARTSGDPDANGDSETEAAKNEEQLTKQEEAKKAEETSENPADYKWDGPVLTKRMGVNDGPSGKETYYNLNMSGVVSIMRDMGNTDEYWVRDDGCKMLGDYIMIAANLSIRPRGSLVPTSLGMGIVCDTGGFVYDDPTQIDIAVSW